MALSCICLLFSAYTCFHNHSLKTFLLTDSSVSRNPVRKMWSGEEVSDLRQTGRHLQKHILQSFLIITEHKLNFHGHILLID